MPSKYKNVTQDDILFKLIELKEEQFDFKQLLLQGDTFWIYCNSRKYFSNYSDALGNLDINIESDEVKSELGNRIDWWPFNDNHNQREWLSVIFRVISEHNMDLRPKALKGSDYFDLYVDATLLFGKYHSALQYAEITTNSSVYSPRNDRLLNKLVEIYVSPEQNTKCQLFSELQTNIDVEVTPQNSDFSNMHVIVDASNVAYVRNKPSLNNISILDAYLQDRGFNRENIVFIFDASFRHVVGPDVFDESLTSDRRYVCAPAGEPSDLIILQAALEHTNNTVNSNPLIISNDKYAEHFEKHQELSCLISRKRGVTWTFILKNRKPVISLLGI